MFHANNHCKARCFWSLLLFVQRQLPGAPHPGFLVVQFACVRVRCRDSGSCGCTCYCLKTGLTVSQKLVSALHLFHNWIWFVEVTIYPALPGLPGKFTTFWEGAHFFEEGRAYQWRCRKHSTSSFKKPQYIGHRLFVSALLHQQAFDCKYWRSLQKSENHQLLHMLECFKCFWGQDKSFNKGAHRPLDLGACALYCRWIYAQLHPTCALV